MNVEEYIASGILESYILGELPSEQRLEVEAMAQNHPEVKNELSAIEESIALLAEKIAVAPPAELKNEILSAIDEDGDKVIPISRGTKTKGSYLVAASISVALLSSIATIYFWNQWQDAEQRFDNLSAQNLILAESYKTTSQEFDQTQIDIAILSNKDYRRVIMNPTTPDGDKRLASVYWNKGSNDVYLDVVSLPELSTDKQYQLWALVGGQPVDAGVFDSTDSSLLIKMKSMSVADAFAVTIEPRGGSVSPTLEDLQVIGNV